MSQPAEVASTKSVHITLPTRAASLARVAMITFAVLAALGTIYLVGLEPLPLFHDAFHDVRHSSGFPCH